MIYHLEGELPRPVGNHQILIDCLIQGGIVLNQGQVSPFGVFGMQLARDVGVSEDFQLWSPKLVRPGVELHRVRAHVTRPVLQLYNPATQIGNPIAKSKLLIVHSFEEEGETVAKLRVAQLMSVNMNNLARTWTYLQARVDHSNSTVILSQLG